MKKYNKSDETLVQIGVQLQLRLDEYKRNELEAVEKKEWSKAGGWQNLIYGVEIAFKEISEHFGDYSTVKQQHYQYNAAVARRLEEIRLLQRATSP